MAVEVVTAIQIGRPRTEVAEFACNPDNATRWYANIKSVEWMSPPPLTVGSRLSFVASFLGRQLDYTYEVVELVPGSKLTMSTQQGPFPMETSYTWEDTTPRGTRMTLRNRGEPTGFSKVGVPCARWPCAGRTRGISLDSSGSWNPQAAPWTASPPDRRRAGPAAGSG
jgi:hypothetical protein